VQSKGTGPALDGRGLFGFGRDAARFGIFGVERQHLGEAC
jgi:hypothetical protein